MVQIIEQGRETGLPCLRGPKKSPPGRKDLEVTEEKRRKSLDIRWESFVEKNQSSRVIREGRTQSLMTLWIGLSVLYS